MKVSIESNRLKLREYHFHLGEKQWLLAMQHCRGKYPFFDRKETEEKMILLEIYMSEQRKTGLSILSKALQLADNDDAFKKFMSNSELEDEVKADVQTAVEIFKSAKGNENYPNVCELLKDEFGNKYLFIYDSDYSTVVNEFCAKSNK